MLFIVSFLQPNLKGIIVMFLGIMKCKDIVFLLIKHFVLQVYFWKGPVLTEKLESWQNLGLKYYTNKCPLSTSMLSTPQLEKIPNYMNVPFIENQLELISITLVLSTLRVILGQDIGPCEGQLCYAISNKLFAGWIHYIIVYG